VTFVNLSYWLSGAVITAIGAESLTMFGSIAREQKAPAIGPIKTVPHASLWKWKEPAYLRPSVYSGLPFVDQLTGQVTTVSFTS
jgi:hypothetical protein